MIAAHSFAGPLVRPRTRAAQLFMFLDAICRYIDPRRLVTTEIFLRGPEYVDLWVSIGVEVEAGGKVLFGKYAGQEIKIDGNEYLIIREEEVLGVIEK